MRRWLTSSASLRRACCARGHFFEMGGNSLSALRLLMRVRDALGTRITIQQLFAAPTVRGIAAAARPAAAPPAEASQLRVVCLQKGTAGRAPLVLVHPAGASSLCYLPLLRRLSAALPVYAIDDAFLTGDAAAFGFGSIGEVAAEALARLADAIGTPPALTLGGWSYGGVVALAMAAHSPPPPTARLRPRRPAARRAARSERWPWLPPRRRRRARRRWARCANSSHRFVGGDAADRSRPECARGGALSRRATRFSTRTIRRRRRASRATSSTCARPRASAPSCRRSRRSPSTVHGRAAAGDHFSMCFGDNAAALADAVAPFPGGGGRGGGDGLNDLEYLSPYV